MPLSEREQRLLDEMERNLYSSDAEFAAALRKAERRPNYRAVVLGALLALLGIAGIFAGVMLHLIVLGVLGFLVVFAGVLFATRTTSHPATGAKPATGKARRSFMDALNDRWDRRQQQ